MPITRKALKVWDDCFKPRSATREIQEPSATTISTNMPRVLGCIEDSCCPSLPSRRGKVNPLNRTEQANPNPFTFTVAVAGFKMNQCCGLCGPQPLP